MDILEDLRTTDRSSNPEFFQKAANEIESLRGALKLYIEAGFGESTDFYKQGKAYDAAIRILR